MGLFDRFRRKTTGGGGHDIAELARRAGMSEADLRAVPVTYRSFTIPKRSGAARAIAAPDAPLKRVQRRLLARVLARLPVHEAATGFERGFSIVSNAWVHAGKAVVVRLDVKDFFAATRAQRVHELFVKLGYSDEAARLMERLCTHDGGLPQGAPTSPRLSNLLNRRLDIRLARLAARLGATYTRYADDITFSFPTDDQASVHGAVRLTKLILRDEGYELHTKKKLHVRRRHQRQFVTGLVVNDGVAVPRRTRRWLRAVEHRVTSGKVATLTQEQLAGWRSYLHMVAAQRAAAASAEGAQ